MKQKGQFFTNPNIGYSQFFHPVQKYNIDRRPPPELKNTKSYHHGIAGHNKSNNQILKSLSDLQQVSSSNTSFFKVQENSFEQLKVIAPKSRSLLQHPVQGKQKISKTLPDQLFPISEMAQNYKMEDHLNYLSVNSKNLEMLSKKMKMTHAEQFKSNAEKLFDKSSTQKILTLFRLMQKNTLLYPRVTEPKHKVILKSLDQLHFLQSGFSPRQFKKQEELQIMMEMKRNSLVPPTSPSPSKQSEYKSNVRKRMSNAMSSSNIELYNQLKQPYVAKDPLEEHKIEKIKFFFTDLLNNITNIQKEHRRGTQELIQTNGCNMQIHDLLFQRNKSDIPILRTTSPQLMYQDYLLVDRIDQSQQTKGIVEQIEKSDLFKRLNYFNNSLLMSIKKRIITKHNKDIELKAELQNEIQASLYKYNNHFDQHLLQKCQPISLRVPQRELLDQILSFKQQGSSPLTQLKSLDMYEWEVLDKQISQTYEMRKEYRG